MLFNPHKLPKMLSRDEKGFTLIELLVVIATIAILTAIAVPAFQEQRKKSYDTTLRSDMKNAATIVETALLGYDSWGQMTADIGLPTAHTTIYSSKNSGVRVPPVTGKFWNDTGKLPLLTHDKGTYIEFVNIPTDLPASNWVQHNPYEYCLFGTHTSGSKYHQTVDEPLTGTTFNRWLFYDVKLGGLVDMEDLVEAVQGKTDAEAAEVSSCHGYAIRFMKESGWNQ